MLKRSDALQAWIQECGTKEKIREKVWTLDEKLRKELLEEALQDDRVRRECKSILDLPMLSQTVKEHQIIETYCKYDEILGTVSMQLDWWNESNAPSSNLIDSSALFCVNRKTRKVLNNELVYSRSTTSIIYSGEELNQDDWDVLSCLLRISANDFNKIHRIKASDILNMLSLPKTSYYYDRIFDSLVRLYKGTMLVKNDPRNAKTTPEAQSMIINFWFADEIKEAKEAEKEKMKPKLRCAGLRLIDYLFFERDYIKSTGDWISFALDSRLIRFFGNNEYGLVNWNQRQALGQNSLAKKLQCYFSGQGKQKRPHSIQTLYSITGMSCDMKKFVSNLKIALEELKSVGIITNYEFADAKRGQSDRRVVWVSREKSQNTESI